MTDPVAVGWATVDMDRAVEAFAPALVPGTAFEVAPDCALLGARCRVGRVRDGAAAAPIVVLLEPNTEGRLAATLARHDEGWCATWETDDDPERRVAASVEVAGPLGPERLVIGSPADGPHRLLVRAVTIRS